MKAIALLFLVAIMACTSVTEPEFDLVVENVNLIDGTGARLQEGVNVYIKKGSIHSITNESPGQQESVIDGTGKYLVPGFFDCHIHTSDYKADFPKFIHFGVTSVLIPGGSTCTDQYFESMRNMGAQDSLPAPRVFHTSQHLSMEGRHPAKTYTSSNWVDGETIFYLKDTQQIATIVEKLSHEPIVGLKLTIEDGPAPPFVERIPQSFINKVKQEADKHSLSVFAHVSDNDELAMAMEAGIQNLLHFTGVDLDWERDQALIKSIYDQNINWVTTLMIDKSFMYPLYPEWIAEIESLGIYDQEMMEEFKAPFYKERAEGYINFFRVEYGIDEPNLENVMSFQVEDIKRLYEDGVNMVLGTDSGNDFNFPGHSLHEEMQLMEMGGIKPIDIITMATSNAAKMLGVLNTHGTLEVGKVADMVLLDKNPLEQIRNTLLINKVFKNGRVQKRIN
jgi:imidazolonepropionase-like amidohydrolase